MAHDSRMVGNSKNREEFDYYPTPYSMTEALFEIEKFEGDVLEPACGEGHMCDIIKQHNECYASDINIPTRKVDNFKHINFLFEIETARLSYDNIITNPPYMATLEFLLTSKRIAMDKIALLLKLDYLHGLERYEKVYQDRKFPLKKVAVFVRRPMFDGVNIEKPCGTGMITYAWFIWDRHFADKPYIEWINNQKDVK